MARDRPMRNRVTPLGDIASIAQRGSWMGNRGILHRGTEVVRFHASKLWIICALEFRGWRARQWEPHHYTVLFFLDEAVALAAGHRPCALCRREAYTEYRSAAGVPGIKAADLDRTLHDQRLVAGTHRRRTHDLPWTAVPAGAFVVVDDEPNLVWANSLRRWTADGYGAPTSLPQRGTATVVTPPLSIEALRSGYPVQVGLPGGDGRA